MSLAVTTDTPEEIESPDVEEIEPEAAPVFHAGDIVRVSEWASDLHGYTSGSVRGKVAKLDYRDNWDGWFVRPTDGGYGAYVASEHLTLLTETDLLQVQVTALTAELATARLEREAASDALTRQAADFAAWKDNMQAVALAAAERNDLCHVFDAVMEEIGLQGREREFEIRVSFDGSTTMSVTATSRDDARDKIDDETLRAHLLSAPSWQVDLDFNTDDDDDDD